MLCLWINQGTRLDLWRPGTITSRNEPDMARKSPKMFRNDKNALTEAIPEMVQNEPYTVPNYP